MPISSFEQSQVIAAVREAAAREILPRFRALSPGDIAAKANPQDLVTAADLAMEAALRENLPQILPGAAILGEEGVAADPAQLDLIAKGGRVIVIDPIDGTFNFVHDLATFGTILAVVEDGRTVFGLLYDPMLDDWIWAAEGEGAWFGTRALTLPDPGPLETLTGMLGSHGLTREEWMGIAGEYHRFGKIKDTGASLWDYRMMAQGQVAFKLNRYCNVWDHAAGVLCMREAGGYAALIDGTPYDPTMREGRLLAAQSEALWHELAEVLRPHVAPVS